MKPARVLRTVLVAALCILALKELLDLTLPLLRAAPSAEPPMSFTQSLSEQELALELARPAGMSREQWLEQTWEPLTRAELSERLQDTPDEAWISSGLGSGTLTALLVPPYARGDEFSAVAAISTELASKLAWGAANDYGWHVFLVDCETDWIEAHVMVQVTRDTPNEVFVLHARDPWAR